MRCFLRLTQQKTKIHLQNEAHFNRVRVVSCKLPDFGNALDSITINLGHMLDTNSDLTTNPVDRKYFFKLPAASGVINYVSNPLEFHYMNKYCIDRLQWFEVECLADGAPAVPTVADPWIVELQFMIAD